MPVNMALASDPTWISLPTATIHFRYIHIDSLYSLVMCVTFVIMELVFLLLTIQ